MSTSTELLSAASASRLLRTEDEVAVFEQALAELARRVAVDPRHHASLLPDLLQLFDDDCVHSEVMWGVVAFVEARELFAVDDYLTALIKLPPQLLSQAEQWVLTLHCRILNSDAYRNRYWELLSAVAPSERAAACQVFQQIAAEKPGMLAERARQMLSVC